MASSPKLAFTFTVAVESKNVVEDASIKWHIDDTYGLRQNWGTYVAGTLGVEPGVIRIKHAGVFTLGCEITDPTGRMEKSAAGMSL